VRWILLAAAAGLGLLLLLRWRTLLGSLSAPAAGLLLMSWGSSFEVISAVNSSPWTAENFGADEKRAKSSMLYTYIGVLISLGLTSGAALLAGSWAPIVGWGMITLVMIYLYQRAIRIGRENNHTGWTNQGG
jgi:hypothetical protein